MSYKNCRLEQETHRLLKIYCAKKSISLDDAINKILLDALGVTNGS